MLHPENFYCTNIIRAITNDTFLTIENIFSIFFNTTIFVVRLNKNKKQLL